MKSKLLKLTVASLMVFTISTQAQTFIPPAVLGAPVLFDGFENWSGSPSQPTGWMQTPNTTLPPSAVTPAITGTATPAEEGSMACNIQNTASTYSLMATDTTYSVTLGMGYEVSYYARGKGTISVGLATGTVTTYPGGESVSGKAWHQYKQSFVAPSSATNAAFFIKVKSTGTYSSGGVTITGIDVDSFCIRPYTPVANANLYSLQYTTLASTNSLYFGQYVAQTGGIVTAVTVGSTGIDGYYVQTTGATSWAAMSVYDYNNAALVHVGDSILFGGNVDEFYNMTQMSGITNFVNVSTANGQSYTLPSLPLTSQSINQEMYEAMLVNFQDASLTSYTSSYGQANVTTDGGASTALVDFKDGFYPPNGVTGGYTPTVSETYCLIGNVYYTFGYNITPRDSGDVYTNCTALGIQKHNSNLNASVYPNPLNNQLTVKLPVIANNVSVSFTDVLGKEVMTTNNLSGSEISINDINLPTGVYMVKIVADGNTQITKVIKQ